MIQLNDPIQIKDPHNLECLSSNGCLALEHTNVRMSGNHKLVYKSDSELFLESISSDDYLSSKTFKNIAVDVNQGYRYNLQQFFSKVSRRSSIWTVKTTEARKSENFSDQYPDMYKWGAYTETNDLIDKRFRFFAPLWTYGKLPDRFLLFRAKNNSYTRARSYLETAELLMSVDMTSSSVFGCYLRTLTEDKNFLQYCIFANFGESFIRYHGIDINSGKFKFNTESDLDSYLANERTIQEFNNAITNGWMRGELLCPNILNLEFAFDDNAQIEGFNNYLGLYVYDNEITHEEANILQAQDGVIVLNYTPEEVVRYEDTAGSYIALPDYTEIISTTSTTQLTKTELAPIAEITLPFKPVPGSLFSIEYNNTRIVEIYMMEEYIRTDSNDEILRMIAEQINETVFNEVILTASVIDSVLVIKSNITSTEYENVIINLPSVFKMNHPTYFVETSDEISEELKYNSLRMVSYQDVIINADRIPDGTTIIEVDGIDYQLEQMFKYRGANVLRLDETFSNVRTIKSSAIKFKKTVSSKFSVLSYVKYVDFDLSMMESPYYDIYDFDMSEYQMALGRQLHETFERYAAGNPTTLDTELIDAYISFFNLSVKDPSELFEIDATGTAVPKKQESLVNTSAKEVLVKDFDELTMFPSSTCKNEFLRLGEQALEQTRNLNRLEPLIAKFAATEGLDSYMNPISLNIALPWRNDNFLATKYQSRSIVNNTHMWFTLGSGPGPIIDGKFKPYLNSIQKQLGYVNMPLKGSNRYNSITVNVLDSDLDPLNTEDDIFQLLKYRYNDDETFKYYKNAEAWSWMYKVDGETNVYNAIYRGCEWSFIGNYEGYRFAVVMVTATKLSSMNEFNSPFILVENQVFKTLMLVVNHYIADKLITSQNGNVPYYLDRSYLYYSSKNYNPSNIDDIQDINSTEAISLNLFRDHIRSSVDDLSERHLYKGQDTTYTYEDRTGLTKIVDTWFRLDETRKPIFYISLNSVVKQLSLKDIVTTSGNVSYLEWFHVTELTDNQISIFIKYTAYDIVDLGDSHLWCRDIFIEFIVNDVYLEDWDSSGNIHHHTMSLEEIIANGKSTIDIDGCTFTIPFWDKISSSEFLELPVTNNDGTQRRGLRLTKEFFEEINANIHFDGFDNYIRKHENKSFIVFDTVEHEGDSEASKEYRISLETKEGTLLEKDQYWFALKAMSKENAVYFNFNASNQGFSTITADYVRNILDTYQIKTYIATKDDIIETSKKITMLSPDETYIIVSLKYNEEKNVLERLSSYTSFKILRLSNYYNPLFKKILQPETIMLCDYVIKVETREDIEQIPYYKRHIGQYIFVKDGYSLWYFDQGILNENIKEVDILENKAIILQNADEITTYNGRSESQIYYIVSEDLIYRFQGGTYDENFQPQKEIDKEYVDCVFPEFLRETYSGRKICTNVDEPDNYCEEFLDSHLKNIYDQYFYIAQYDGITRQVIGDAALSEHRGFISNTYYNNKEIEITVPFAESINLIDATRDLIAPAILSQYRLSANPNMTDMLNAMKLYNSELDEHNIVYENYYNAFYKRFFIEFFQKHYKVSTVTASNDMYHKIDFYYQDYENINLKTTSVDGTAITSVILTFKKI